MGEADLGTELLQTQALGLYQGLHYHALRPGKTAARKLGFQWLPQFLTNDAQVLVHLLRQLEQRFIRGSPPRFFFSKDMRDQRFDLMLIVTIVRAKLIQHKSLLRSRL
jgi:hypothetical protein